MKNSSFAGKFSRTKIFTVITAALIILLLALNMFISYFGIFGTAYIDMTPEGLYTLRDEMVDTCEKILVKEDGTPLEPGIKITFCNDPDKLIENTFTRVVYYMAVAMAEEFDNFEIETINVKYDPMAVSMYKTTSLTEITPYDVIISCGTRYRILSAESFWRVNGEEVYSYDGEYKLASIMMSLTLINQPKAYFVTGHGEDIYDKDAPESEMSKSMAYMKDLLSDRGLEVEKLNITELVNSAKEHNKANPNDKIVPKIPDDCAVLIINNPKSDFIFDENEAANFSYVSETELLDRFMTDGRGAIMVAKDYATELPNLEAFLAEWGIAFSNTLVKDTENAVTHDGKESGVTLVGKYNTDEGSYAHQIYGEYSDLTSAPQMLLTNTGYIKCSFEDSISINESGSSNTTRMYTPFLFTSDKASAYGKNSDSGAYVDLAAEAGKKDIAVIAARSAIDGYTSEYTFSYIFCAASAQFFTSEMLGNASYANYDVVSAAVQSIARLDTYATEGNLGGLSLNNYTGFGGKPLVSEVIGESEKEVFSYDETGKAHTVKINYGLSTAMKVVYTCIVAVIPLSVAVVGIVVCLKRKFL